VRGFQGPRSFWLRPSTSLAEQVAVPAGRPAVSADFPILASRITAPGVPDWAVQRPRVTELIAESTRWCPLTVVTGPAGAGKTMDLALRAAAEPGTVAWVYLDDNDNQPGVFWSCLVAAPGRAGIPVPKALSTATRGQAADHLFLLRLRRHGGDRSGRYHSAAGRWNQPGGPARPPADKTQDLGARTPRRSPGTGGTGVRHQVTQSAAGQDTAALHGPYIRGNEAK
jgi:hypothetical protein